MVISDREKLKTGKGHRVGGGGAGFPFENIFLEEQGT